jgi:hypothetical protein
MSVQSSLALADLKAAAFGLGVPEVRTLPQQQDEPDDPASASHIVPVIAEHAAVIEASTRAADGDLDLYLVYDRNGDGYFDFVDEAVAKSTTATANEQIRVTFPPDGSYIVAVHGWGAEPGANFELSLNVVQGGDLRVIDLPAGPHGPGAEIDFTVTWGLDAPLPEGGEAEGIILLGPPGAESAIPIPVRLHNDLEGLPSARLIATDDARIFAGIPNDLHGTHKHLYVGANDTSRSVLRFDLSALPPGARVASAELRLYVELFGGGGSPANLAAYRLGTEWSEKTVNWNLPWQKKGGDFVEPPVSARVSKADVGKFVELDVTSWAREWAADSSSNAGVILRLIDQTSFTYYRLPSGEYWTPAQAPTLVVKYELP